MIATIKITIHDGPRTVQHEFSEPVELGRQDTGDGELYVPRKKDNRTWRIPIARPEETTIGRQQVRVDVLPHDKVRLTNVHNTVPFTLGWGSRADTVNPQDRRELRLPVELHFGSRRVLIEGNHPEVEMHLESLAQAPAPPGARELGATIVAAAIDEIPEGDRLVPWLQATMDVLQAAATSVNCFDRAAHALVDMIDLDAGRVLLLEKDKWLVKTERMTSRREVVAPQGWRPSSYILDRLRREKLTFWQVKPGNLESLGQFASLAGVEALVAAPILDRQGEVVGALYGDRRSTAMDATVWSGGTRTQLQVMMVQLLASGVAAAMAHRKHVQMERELEIGRRMQADFFPAELPQTAGWELVARFESAREVSGDFYDAFTLPGGRLVLVLADVCDKGVGAALYMTLFRSLLRTFTEQAAGRELSAVERTNKYVAGTHQKDIMFMTLFFGILDPATGVLEYINAGHDAPAILGPRGIKVRLKPTSPAVGVDRDAEFDGKTLHLDAGDTLFAFTDGVTDARNRTGQRFMEKRLLPLLEKPVTSAAELVNLVRTKLHEFMDGADAYDDVTMLAMRRLG